MDDRFRLLLVTLDNDTEDIVSFLLLKLLFESNEVVTFQGKVVVFQTTSAEQVSDHTRHQPDVLQGTLVLAAIRCLDIQSHIALVLSDCCVTNRDRYRLVQGDKV